MAYVSVIVEGGLFPPDLLDRISSGDAQGQRATDFGVDGSRKLIDEIQAAFSDSRSFWDAFQRRLQHSRESATTLTREAWIIPILERLGFDLLFQRSVQVGGDSYAISHRIGDDTDAPPVHIASIEDELDKRGSARRSPHALVQEYLNRTDALWGLVTNGSRLRLLRDSARLSKPTYLEFDLEGMVVGNLYSEFALLYRLLHASRFPRDATNAHQCLLEQYYQQGLDEGSRIRDKLRDNVEHALRTLGTAFLTHPNSVELRERFNHGALDAPYYYRQLLRLVYRLLFLMVAEERRLIFPPGAASGNGHAVYSGYYSIGRLRDRAERYFAGDKNADLWLGLCQTFGIFRHNDMAQKLGLSALDGELFNSDACPDLESAHCTNEQLLSAVRALSTFAQDGTRRRVNYAGLDVEEFGSVYESLLDFHPQVSLDPPSFDLAFGSERKQTGSYYTPPELVRELIESALVPVVEEKLACGKTREAKEKALLEMKVCDPASGSGHFLLAAARKIAQTLSRVRSGEDEPSPEEYRQALRDIIRQCVYAVDKNPLAVDLCKVALWIEGHNAGLPLSFLDHHIKCGDSLVGVFDLAVLERGIPDEAYKAVASDDKKAAIYYRNKNKHERAGQLAMDMEAEAGREREALSQDFGALAELEERTSDDVQAKEKIYESLRAQEEWKRLKTACDLWTYAFFTPMPLEGVPSPIIPTTGTLRDHLFKNSARADAIGAATGYSQAHPFFHWPLEFPEVFQRGGFDVVLGNPPWERIKFQEQEFFAARDPEIARAPNKAARERLIKTLPERSPALANEFAEAKHRAEAESKFVREAGRFPLCGLGDINTYALFAEQFRRLLETKGHAGVIVPTGIATDDTYKGFFGEVASGGSVASLYDFENKEALFPGVHRSYKFCLLTLRGSPDRERPAQFAFFLHRPEQLRDEESRFALTADDFALFNPNTRTCPVFRTGRDADITRAIYRRAPVLMNEHTGENTWGVNFLAMFHMSNDSHLFKDAPGPGLLPLYEGKMVQAFDHRAASVFTNLANLKRPGQPIESSLQQHLDPTYRPEPQYWVSRGDVIAAISTHLSQASCFMAFKSVTSPTNERTMIASFLPFSGVANSMIVVGTNQPLKLLACLLANLNSLALDYCAKQKVGGVNLNFFFVKQFPILRPNDYAERDVKFIFDRILELTYTAWDLHPFAQDCGYDGPPFRWDEDRRFFLRCEMDAAFFHLYGMERQDVDYIMKTFPIVKRRDEQRFGEYRTRRVILEIYDEMLEAHRIGIRYKTRLDPPPAHPSIAHPPRSAPLRSASLAGGEQGAWT